MRKAGTLANPIGSVEQLLAVAGALEREATERYRGLSARMTRQGDAAMAAQFAALADLEARHIDQVADRAQSALGRPAAPLSVEWELPATYAEDEARGAEVAAYQALGFAVRNEERGFAFYVYVAAAADDPAVRRLAEDLARDELEHAALLRRWRRRAFHGERPVEIETPADVETLLAAAQRWDDEAATTHATLAEALDAAGDAEDAAIFRRLAADERRTAGGAVGVTAATLRGAADGLRLLEERFDRFALIAERSRDERVVAVAQRLASETVARLAAAGGARNNDLLAAAGADRSRPPQSSAPRA